LRVKKTEIEREIKTKSPQECAWQSVDVSHFRVASERCGWQLLRQSVYSFGLECRPVMASCCARNCSCTYCK